MSKPREFWIEQSSFGVWQAKESEQQLNGWKNKTHVREVRPIDWDAIKNKYQGPPVFTESWNIIIDLVEKELKGELE